MEELFIRAKNGDKLAFEEMINLLQPNLYKIAVIRLKNESVAKEILQDTFIILYMNIKKIRDAEKLKYWITRVLINNCNKYWKKNKNLISFDEIEAEKYIFNKDDFEKIEQEIIIDKYFRKISEEEKMILTLYYLGDYTSKEISKLLKIKESTIRSKIKRALEKIKESE